MSEKAGGTLTEHAPHYTLEVVRLREVPASFKQPDRVAYLAIADRAANEAVNCFTLLSLGVQSFVEKDRLFR